MPPKRSSPTPPHIDPPHLVGLRVASADELSNRELVGLRFVDAALDELRLGGTHLDGVAFDGLGAPIADLIGADLLDVGFTRIDLPVTRAARGRWRCVQITGRIGSLDAHDAEWSSVRFVGCKLGFVNLRGAKLLDVAFTDCLIEELDLGASEVQRLALGGTNIGTLDLREARLTDVDLRGAGLAAIEGVPHLRGATISEHQLAEFAPLLAREFGLRIES